jgi:hypothetical protein
VKSSREFLCQYSQSLTRWFLHARDRHTVTELRNPIYTISRDSPLSETPISAATGATGLPAIRTRRTSSQRPWNGQTGISVRYGDLRYGWVTSQSPPRSEVSFKSSRRAVANVLSGYSSNEGRLKHPDATGAGLSAERLMSRRASPRSELALPLVRIVAARR